MGKMAEIYADKQFCSMCDELVEHCNCCFDCMNLIEQCSCHKTPPCSGHDQEAP